MTRNSCWAFFCLLAAVFTAGCTGTHSQMAGSPVAAEAVFQEGLSPGQQYAGRVLAYLMQVVLGRAGPEELRSEWGRRGLDVPLDFKRISSIMLEPGQNRAQLVVFDTRIFGISEVLYHYDPRLNLFKGTEDRQSLFPSVELIALRLLLLQKMARGEKLRLEAVAARKALLFDPRLPVTEKDHAATGLSRSEMALLRETLSSDPHLFRYLVYPPMVRTLYEIGAIESDSLVALCLGEAVQTGSGCRFSTANPSKPPLRIALLPSITRHFTLEPGPGGKSAADFRPNAFYRRISETLKQRIVKQAEAVDPSAAGFLIFSGPSVSPQVIYPENHAAEIRRICPKADFAVILVDKDVLRSFNLSSKHGNREVENLLYIDIMDIEHSLIDPELEAVGRFIASRLK